MRVPNTGAYRSSDAVITLQSVLSSTQKTKKPVGKSQWRATNRTLRIAATTCANWLTGYWHVQHWLVDDPRDISAIEPFSDLGSTPVTLVVLSRQDDPALPGLIDRYANFFHDVVIVLDGNSEAEQPDNRVRYITRPLDGDFSSQRNAGTWAAKGDWVFHLDTDEALSDDFCVALPHLASAARRSGYAAVGFPRRNFVDGNLSDLFPDIQYRLIRRDIPFEGRVHERPAVCKAGHLTIVSQHGVIDHRLDRERVRTRSAQYDRLGQEPARHADDRALMTPFRG